MLVWNAMPSITVMIAEIFWLLSVIWRMVATTSCTAVPPLAAAPLARLARSLACPAMSALLLTVEPICSIDAAVCCRLLACSSVRWLRSALPVAIWAEPVAMLSLLERTCATIVARLARMSRIAENRLVESPARTGIVVDRSPAAIRRAAACASCGSPPISRSTVRAINAAPVMPATNTASISARLATMAPWRLSLAADAALADVAAILSPAWASKVAGARSMPLTAMSPAADSKPAALKASKPLR